MSHRVAVTLPLTLASWLAAVVPATAQKIDVVELVNGDRITCEIQKLDHGKLTVKTDGIGTIAIEWDDVVRVASLASYDVELESGTRLLGTLARADPYTLNLLTGFSTERLELGKIVRLTRLGRTFWKSLDGSIAGGFNFTQADVQTQTTFDASVSYRGRKWLANVSFDSLATTREDVDSQTRNDLLLQAQRFIRPRWSYIGLGSLQQNEELSLDLRTVVGGGLVRVLKQSNRTLVQADMAVVYTREQYQGEDGQNVAEAVAGLGWDWFTFDGRSTNLDLGLQTYIALRKDSRVRAELNVSFKSDIVGDLYWSVSLVESLNSDPPEGRKKSDLSISATIGWTF